MIRILGTRPSARKPDDNASTKRKSHNTRDATAGGNRDCVGSSLTLDPTYGRDLRRLLGHRRCVAHQRGAADVARLVVREWSRAMHGLAVVPHDEIAHPPLVRIDELALGGGL